MRRSLLLLPLFVTAACGPGEVVRVYPDTYLQALDNLGPGDTMMFMPGVYAECLDINGLAGTAAQRITLVGPETGPPAIIEGSNCGSPGGRVPTMIRIQNASYINIRNLELDGQGMGVVGLQAGYGTPPVHSMTVENLYVHDNGTSSQITGISVFTTSWDWVIRNNRLENVGLGIYLGNSDGADPFIRGVVEGNVIINPRGYGMQIKHQFPRINVQGMPQTDSVTYIRHNVFIKERNSVTGNAARPNLLIGDLPPNGIGSDDRYEIYGNFFFQNDSDTEGLFQGEGNYAFHDNVLFNTFNGGGMVAQPHNGLPREIAIYRNTIYAPASGIFLTGGDFNTTQIVQGNAVFSNQPISADNERDNITGTPLDGMMALNDLSGTLGQLDLHPRLGQLIGSNVDYSAFSHHEDWDLDFNGDPVDTTRRGAYAGEGMNPGWMLAADNKPVPGQVVPPPPDAGMMPPPIDAGFDDSGVAIDAGQPVFADATVAADATADPPADAGTGGNNNGGGNNMGGVPMGGSGRATTGGCRCVDEPTTTPWALLMLLGLWGVRRRR